MEQGRLTWNSFDIIRERSQIFLITVNGELKIAQKTAFKAQGRQYTTGKVIERLLYIDL